MSYSIVFPQLLLCTIVWIAASVAIINFQWTSREGSIGLPSTYLLSLTGIHFFGACLYMLPWYVPSHVYIRSLNVTPEFVTTGFEYSTLGLVGFMLGTIYVGPQFVSGRRPESSARLKSLQQTVQSPKRFKNFIGLGLVFLLILVPLTAELPSVGAAISSGASFVVIGFSLQCYNALRDGNNALFFKWLLAAALIPVATVGGSGFMSYGASAFLAICVFAAQFYRPRWKVVALSLVAFYLGLSLMVTWLKEREELRTMIYKSTEKVSRIQKIRQRIEKVGGMAMNFRFLDPFNIPQLELIDIRLNQNYFVGQGVQYMQRQQIDFAGLTTVYDGVVAMVPRVLWPGKPNTAGGSYLLTKYTGRRFSSKASFGIGNILEFYACWGAVSVLFGMMALGAVIQYCDQKAFEFLKQGDEWRFACYYLIGLAFINPGNQFSAILSRFAASLALIFALNAFANRKRTSLRSKAVAEPSNTDVRLLPRPSGIPQR